MTGDFSPEDGMEGETRIWSVLFTVYKQRKSSRAGVYRVCKIVQEKLPRSIKIRFTNKLSIFFPYCNQVVEDIEQGFAYMQNLGSMEKQEQIGKQTVYNSQH